MVLWEIVGYLADDVRRGTAYTALRERVGLTPEAILAAPDAVLEEITRMGGAIAVVERAERLRTAALLGDLDEVLCMPFPKAKKRLMRYPMIGEPGAEKILLFCGVLPVLALESNGLRVLVRYGIGEEKKSYAATYRSVREAVLGELSADCGALRRAHLLLRRHGQEVCLRNGPACGRCPVRSSCPSSGVAGATRT
jgi:endonuclease-3